MTKRLVVGVGAVALIAATVLVFLAFDRGSHSASDTLRPFLLTMAPVWVVAVVTARSILGHDDARE